MLECGIADDTLAYCNQARRLRKQHANRPARLYHSLCELSARYDSQISHQNKAGSVAGEFAQTVAATIDTHPLQYSTRLQLLNAAQARGIDRFEANLIIAGVQHRLESQGCESIEPTKPAARPAVWFLAALTVQSAIVSAIWLLLR